MKTPLRAHTNAAFVIGEYKNTGHHSSSQLAIPTKSLWLARTSRGCAMLTTGSLAGLSSELQGVRGRGFASPGHRLSLFRLREQLFREGDRVEER